ncbi:MAG: hypothetical protein ACOYVF_03115 [Candidatus Zixiibacteriota bacterium]
MDIGPLKSNGSVLNDNPEKRKRAVENSPGQLKDTIEISEDARKKLAELADAALLKTRADEARTEADLPVEGGESGERAELSKEVIDEIRQRMESGFYDNPDVKGRIVDRIIDDLAEE